MTGNGSDRTVFVQALAPLSSAPSGAVGSAAPMRYAGDGAAVLASAGGAEEAAGGPTTPVIPGEARVSLGQREGVGGATADGGQRGMTSTVLRQAGEGDDEVKPKREGSAVREGRGRRRSLEGSRGRATTRAAAAAGAGDAWTPGDTEQSGASVWSPSATVSHSLEFAPPYDVFESGTIM